MVAIVITLIGDPVAVDMSIAADAPELEELLPPASPLELFELPQAATPAVSRTATNAAVVRLTISCSSC
jgi:hypothetical protein